MTCKLNGLEVEVDYDYEPAQRGGWEDPSWDAYVSINSVCVGKHDITEFLTDGTIGMLSDKIMESECSGRTEPKETYGEAA